jgi:2-oxoglutarate ferredoxin oxidoreductase subunit alpha
MEKKINNLSWMIGGEAGVGIQSAGHFLALLCSRAGLYVFGNAEYPSLIRGGHNSNLIRVADQEVSIHTETVNLLLAMNKETLDLHVGEISTGGGVIYDGETIKDYDFTGLRQAAGKTVEDITIFNVPLKKLAMEKGQGEITRNTVGLGASLALVGLDIKYLLEVLKGAFARKGEAVVAQNLAAAQAGYDYIIDNFGGETVGAVPGSVDFAYKLVPVERQSKRIILTGNEAVCLGALKAGVKFVAEYPMTPSSTVLHFMAARARDFNIIVKHTEDELAAINMVVGAAWAGARAMTATSGGGFALMSEALGMAGMIEAPAVIYEAQRGGPSTGLPTRTEQSDLRFAMHASQGEFPRLVVAPGDYRELFYKTFEAFNIADKFQMPAVILSDKHLGESLKNIEPFETDGLRVERGKLVTDRAELERLLKNGYATPDGGFLRYKLEEDGVSPRTLPGLKGGRHRASTDEHDETGDLTETPENRTAMHAKRMRKLEGCLAELPAPELVGPGLEGAYTAGPAFGLADGPAERVEPADITFVTWGSPKDAVLEAMQKLLLEGVRANMLQIIYFVPFHADAVRGALEGARVKVGVEMNYEAQMAAYIREKTGVALDANILNWSGRQMTAEEILRKTGEILRR